MVTLTIAGYRPVGASARRNRGAGPGDPAAVTGDGGGGAAGRTGCGRPGRRSGRPGGGAGGTAGGMATATSTGAGGTAGAAGGTGGTRPSPGRPDSGPADTPARSPASRGLVVTTRTARELVTTAPRLAIATYGAKPEPEQRAGRRVTDSPGGEAALSDTPS